MKKRIALMGLISILVTGCSAPLSAQNTGTGNNEVPPSSIEAPGDVVSAPGGPQTELTREDMLIAQPMPMSGEERQFVFSHKSVQELPDWTLDDFKDYTSSPMGRDILFREGQRWIDIRIMLRAQVEFAKDFLVGKSKRPQPLPPKPVPPVASLPAPATDGAAPGVSAGSSAGEVGAGAVPSMNLYQNKTADDLFMPDASALIASTGEHTFARLKKVRADISTYCKELDELTKIAERRKLTHELEEAMSSVQWD